MCVSESRWCGGGGREGWGGDGKTKQETKQKHKQTHKQTQRQDKQRLTKRNNAGDRKRGVVDKVMYAN